MELRHLRYFVAVAEELSFARAAERLHVSQPPLSTQIRDLEDELGAALFERHARGVTLTAAGDAFYLEARAVLARVEQARLAARRAGDGEIGRLEVAFVSLVDYSVLPPTLRAFSARYPGVELRLREETTDAQVEALLRERVDVGFAIAPVDEPDLAFEPLLDEGLVLALPAAHPRAAGDEPLALAGMAHEPFVLFPRPLAIGLHDAIVGCCRDAGFSPRVAQHAKQMQTIVSLVSAGLGVALVPESVRNLRRPGVAYRDLAEASPRIRIGVLHRRASRNPAVARFVAVAKAAAAGAPPAVR